MSYFFIYERHVTTRTRAHPRSPAAVWAIDQPAAVSCLYIAFSIMLIFFLKRNKPRSLKNSNKPTNIRWDYTL